MTPAEYAVLRDSLEEAGRVYVVRGYLPLDGDGDGYGDHTWEDIYGDGGDGGGGYGHGGCGRDGHGGGSCGYDDEDDGGGAGAGDGGGHSYVGGYEPALRGGGR